MCLVSHSQQGPGLGQKGEPDDQEGAQRREGSGVAVKVRVLPHFLIPAHHGVSSRDRGGAAAGKTESKAEG